MSVRIWLIDYTDADLDQLESAKKISSQDTLELSTAACSEVRLQNIVRDISLRHALSQEYALPFDEWSFAKSDLGKPFLRNIGFEHLKFSVSHSAKHLAIILASGGNPLLSNVGIDVEPISRSGQAEKLKNEFLSEGELSIVNRMPEQEIANVILKHWTLKESISKAVGLGLGLPFSSITLRAVDQSQPQIISFADNNLYEPSEFHLKSYEPKPGLQLAYCIQGPYYGDEQPQTTNLNFSEVLKFQKLMPILQCA